MTQGDVLVERDTYKQSRQGLDEMYNEAQRQLKEECQLRQVSVELSLWNSQEAWSCGLCKSSYVWSYFQDVENELVAQVSMKQEMELAMKLLEKDIHEKQVSPVSPRFTGHRFTPDVDKRKYSSKIKETLISNG